MKTLCISVVTLLAGVVLGSIIADRPAMAQIGTTALHGRYQISAYGSANSNIAHGFYAIDTANGRIWHSTSEGKLEKVIDKMP